MAEPIIEPTPTEPTPTEPTPPEPKEPPAEPKPSFTQSDIDKAVEAAVKAAKEGWDKERSEAERLAKLSKDEREKEQFRLDREKLDADRAKLDRELLVHEAAKQLREKGVPEMFAERVIGKDADETKSNIDGFAKEWSDAIQSGINERLKGSPPPMPGGGSPGASMADVIKNSITQGF